MLVGVELYEVVKGYMPAESIWDSDKPNSLFLQKFCDGIVLTFRQVSPLAGPCGTGPTPHTHMITLNPGTLVSKLNECGFSGQAVNLISHLGSAVSGVLASATQLSIMDGCTPHSHVVAINLTESQLASALLPGGLTGQFALYYITAMAKGILHYIPENLEISIAVHPAPHFIT